MKNLENIKQNQDNLFLEKIVFEPAICKDENFCVVDDINPIIPGHLLLFPLIQASSFADCSINQLISFFDTFFSKVKENKGYMLFERGRANFCSSFNGVVHAHGHLIPSALCSGVTFDVGTIIKYESLREALEAIPSKSKEEYLLWGDVQGKFNLIYPLSLAPKRMIRNTLTKTITREKLISGK